MLVNIDFHDLVPESSKSCISTMPHWCFVLRMLLRKNILQILFEVLRNILPRFIGVFTRQERSTASLCIDSDAVVRVFGGITSMNSGLRGKECADTIIYRKWKLGEGLQKRRFTAAGTSNSNQLVSISVISMTSCVIWAFEFTWGKGRLVVSI